MAESVTLDEVRRAAKALSAHVCRTPLRLSQPLSEHTGADVRLKLETMQDTGAFKLRGATYKLLCLDDEERSRGVVAVSTGNHGRGVAYAARRLGVRAAVFMSELVPNVKIEAIRALDAEVVIAGKNQDEAEEAALARVAEEGSIYVPPFDDPHVIAGQGTIGREIIDEAPDTDTIVVPLSGGGLIGGIAVAAKGMKPDIRIVGVSMEHGAAMVESQRAHKPVQVEEVPTLADSLGGGIGMNNAYTFDLVRDLVDELVLVSEDQIAEAMAWLYWNDRLVAEGAGAVGVAAVVNWLAGDLGKQAAIFVSGCNVDMRAFTDIVRKHKP